MYDLVMEVDGIQREGVEVGGWFGVLAWREHVPLDMYNSRVEETWSL